MIFLRVLPKIFLWLTTRGPQELGGPVHWTAWTPGSYATVCCYSEVFRTGKKISTNIRQQRFSYPAHKGTNEKNTLLLRVGCLSSNKPFDFGADLDDASCSPMKCSTKMVMMVIFAVL